MVQKNISPSITLNFHFWWILSVAGMVVELQTSQYLMNSFLVPMPPKTVPKQTTKNL